MVMAVSFAALLAVLSCDVTRGLVNDQGMGLGYDTDLAASTGTGRFTATLNTSGLPYPALAITNATNATPIVVTTQYPHGVSARGQTIGGMACVIAGVTGNTAANNVSTDPNDRTVGQSQGVLAVPLSATTLALYGQDADPASPTVGRLIPLVGNGVYAGGGTIMPALNDGTILLGRDTVREHSAPPRIVMIPRGVAEWGPRTGGFPNGNRTGERRRQTSQRAIRTEWHVFDVLCWGQSTPPNTATDYDPTAALYRQVIDSAHLLTGTPEDRITGGVWDDEKERATQQIKAGHLFTFSIALAIPDLDTALPFAPSDTVIVPTTRLGSEVGCTG